MAKSCWKRILTLNFSRSTRTMLPSCNLQFTIYKPKMTQNLPCATAMSRTRIHIVKLIFIKRSVLLFWYCKRRFWSKYWLRNGVGSAISRQYQNLWTVNNTLGDITYFNIQCNVQIDRVSKTDPDLYPVLIPGLDPTYEKFSRNFLLPVG